MRTDSVAVWWDPASEGITSKSLLNLRTALVGAYHKPAVVALVETSDMTCGFLVVVKETLIRSINFLSSGIDYSTLRATWTGDGFRLDEGGEGGRGMRAARNLLDLFGHSRHLIMGEPWHWELKSAAPGNLDPYVEIEKDKFASLCAMTKNVIEDLIPEDFRRAADIPPQY